MLCTKKVQRKYKAFISGRFPMKNSVSIVRITHLCRLGYFFRRRINWISATWQAYIRRFP